jgi:hypothetical protein
MKDDKALPGCVPGLVASPALVKIGNNKVEKGN